MSLSIQTKKGSRFTRWPDNCGLGDAAEVRRWARAGCYGAPYYALTSAGGQPEMLSRPVGIAS